jgi:hypothetical protein
MVMEAIVVLSAGALLAGFGMGLRLLTRRPI